jgi:predicted DNA-binding protein (MmcQ/YjbR family)
LPTGRIPAMSSPQQRRSGSAQYEAVRAYALRFPESHEDFPWGHSAIKVRGKIFVSLVETHEDLRLSLKLTDSNFEALLLPFTEPAHYGMGKHGWVTATFARRASAPLSVVRAWIEESYRAVAPKKAVKLLDEQGLAKELPTTTTKAAKKRRRS